MSLRHANQPQFPLRGLRPGPAAPWVRPADWPGLPWIPDSEQALVGLIAVANTQNERLSVLCSGAYSVDWGDGSATENVPSGVKVTHVYTYGALSSKVTSHGYKTATVKISPQSGQNLTFISLYERDDALMSSPWLDVQINAANLTALTLTGSAMPACMLQCVHIRKHALTNCSNLFNGLMSLRKVYAFDTNAVTNVNSIFENCAGIEETPLLDFSNVLTAVNAFAFCDSLESIPEYDFSSATNVNSLLFNCLSIFYVGNINVSSATSTASLFYGNRSIRHVGPINLSQSTNLSTLFEGCGSLSRSEVTGVKVTHSYANCHLPATAIDEIFTNLASGVTGQTITVTGNPGAATCTPSIATAKGWTVVT